MAEKTGISWAEGTHNWWIGCQETGSPACVPCYARELNARYQPKPKDGGEKVAPNWGPHAPRRLTSESNRAQILAWNKNPAKLKPPEGQKPFVFGGSMMDFADNKVPAEWRADQFATYRSCSNLVFLMLTKRIGNVFDMAQAAGGWGANMALGITCVTQEELDRDVPKLIATAIGLASIGQAPLFLFLSLEPIAERLVLRPEWLALIRWVIVGGPTDQGKHKAWAIHPDWVRELRDAVLGAGAIFHFKQWGEWLPFEPGYPGITRDDRTGSFTLKTDGRVYDENRVVGWGRDGVVAAKVGYKVAGNLLDGVAYTGRPEIAA